MKNKIIIFASLLSLASCNPSKEEKNVIDEVDAEMHVEYYIRKQLISPSTAKFHSSTATKKGANEYEVIGVVDAQNMYGATVRETYWVIIKFNNDGTRHEITSKL